MSRLYPQRVFAFLFYDAVRLVELLSALNLLSWALVFLARPALLARDNYQTFQSLDAHTWIAIFTGAALLQFAGMIAWHRHVPELRFVAMAIAAGCWATITANFLSGTVGTTATANYALLTFVTAVSGGFLGWKTSSSHS